MNTYVLSAYFISFVLIIGELIFAVSRYVKSKKTLSDLKRHNEEKT